MKNRQRGFTLTELIVVSAIVAILLGIAIPSYKYISTSYRMSAEVNGLLGDLQFARSEALKEGNGVTACVSSDGASCTGGADWSPGWIVFSDPNANATVDGGERLLKVQSAFTGTSPGYFRREPQHRDRGDLQPRGLRHDRGGVRDDHRHLAGIHQQRRLHALPGHHRRRADERAEPRW